MREAAFRHLRRGRRDQRGATSVEYALLATMIAVFIIGSVVLFGGGTASLFSRTCSSLPANLTSCE